MRHRRGEKFLHYAPVAGWFIVLCIFWPLWDGVLSLPMEGWPVTVAYMVWVLVTGVVYIHFVEKYANWLYGEDSRPSYRRKR